ncbi:tyrosine-protein kinase domain-containing protein [Nocardioides pacificus]
MELREYLGTLRRQWVLVLTVTSLLVAVSAVLTFISTPQYSSSARLFVSTTQADTAEAYQGGLFSAQRVTSYADLATSRELAQSVIDDLGLSLSAEELTARISASVVPETVILEVAVLDEDPAEAQRLAEAVAEALVAMVREIETPAGRTEPPIRASIVDPASYSDFPVAPRPVRNLALGLVLGLLLGFGLAVLRELMDTTIKSSKDVESIVDIPLMGTIAYDSSTRSRPLISSLDSHAPRVESFRVLRTNLQFLEVDRSDKVVVITSALPAEGKTTTAINLAIALAQSEQRVMLVECDLRRPRAAAALGLDNSIGVTTVLVGKVSLQDATQRHDGSGLFVLASGAIPPNPAELLQSKAMAELLDSLREEYDVVLIDAPPLLPVTDAALLTAKADGALMVLRHGKTTKDQLAHALDRLQQVDGRVLGVVLNMVPVNRGGRYGYGYGYGYAPSSVPVLDQSTRAD